MDISEVEAFLSTSRLPYPQHVFIVNETVWQKVDGQVVYRGLQPRARPDVIVLTPQAIDETIPHEIGHTIGLRELGATLLGKISAWKNHILKHSRVHELTRKNVRYEKCSACIEFPKAHEYGSRVEHFKLVRD